VPAYFDEKNTLQLFENSAFIITVEPKMVVVTKAGYNIHRNLWFVCHIIYWRYWQGRDYDCLDARVEGRGKGTDMEFLWGNFLPLVRPRNKCQSNIKLDLMEISSEGWAVDGRGPESCPVTDFMMNDQTCSRNTVELWLLNNYVLIWLFGSFIIL
jgi:hypothetical protein